jgi:predicted nucleic acid-binding protein
MTTLPRNRQVLAVVDTQVFVKALASRPHEARFYACAIQKCWKFVFSTHITNEYQRVLQEYGFRGDVVIHELNKLYAMNKYRESEADPELVPDGLAPRKDKHIIAPCMAGDANVVITDDGGIQQLRNRITIETGAVVLSRLEAEELLGPIPDCFRG